MVNHMTAQTQNYRVIGSALKGVSLLGDEGWRSLSGEPDDDTNKPTGFTYYKRVPWLFRGTNLRSDAVSTMPFALMQGETEYDSSKDWQNKVGFLPNPKLLLWLIEASITLTGRAYLFRDRTALETRRLRYILPTGATPVDLEKGPDGFEFERTVNNTIKRFKPVQDIPYYWSPDPENEIGPSDKSPAVAAMAACGVLLSVDVFAANFFEQGAVKATVFGVKNSPIETERKRLRDWLRDILGGIRNANKIEVVNAEAVVPMTIGEGLAGLQNTDLTAEKREDISTALGIPQTLLFSTGAGGLGGGGVVEQDDKHFYDKFVVPECEKIAAWLNEQIFTPMNLRFTFLPETLDLYQEDENQRAAALKQYVDAGFPLLMACDLLGVELSDEQRAELEKAEKEKQAQAEAMQQATVQAANKPPQEKPGQPANEPPANDNQKADLKRWERKASKKLEKEGIADVNFESEHIPADLAVAIHAKLADCKTVEDVHAAFTDPLPVSELPAAKSDALDITALIAELKRANDLLEREAA